MVKKATYRFFLCDAKNNPVNLESLPENKQEEIGRRVYKTLVKALGFEETAQDKAV